MLFFGAPRMNFWNHELDTCDEHTLIMVMPISLVVCRGIKSAGMSDRAMNQEIRECQRVQVCLQLVVLVSADRLAGFLGASPSRDE